MKHDPSGSQNHPWPMLMNPLCIGLASVAAYLWMSGRRP
jgi:hypothetical protein